MSIESCKVLVRGYFEDTPYYPEACDQESLLSNESRHRPVQAFLSGPRKPVINR
jgi:hypothetical protein